MESRFWILRSKNVSDRDEAVQRLYSVLPLHILADRPARGIRLLMSEAHRSGKVHERKARGQNQGPETVPDSSKGRQTAGEAGGKNIG